MGILEVRDIRVYAYHGCLPQEERVGAYYRVGITVVGDLTKAHRTDALTDTVDYGRITELVKQEMAVRSRLIEHVAHRILVACRAQWPRTALRWTVCVVKEHPPVQGVVAEVAYTVEG
jgi:7,8-dihydroneopterin aldolase/epimerase/oxygenase